VLAPDPRMIQSDRLRGVWQALPRAHARRGCEPPGLIGFAWYNHRTFSHLSWAFFKRTFVEDRPFLVMLLGGVVLLLARGLKLASR
jgi:hypothetical protein